MKDSQFPGLYTPGLYEHLKWLRQLPHPIRKIVSFGCIGSEPFALLWTLDAVEVKVVEKNEAELSQPLGPLEEFADLKRLHSLAFEGRSVEFIIADMSSRVEELLTDYFDLAYCENVLYYMHPSSPELKNAIGEMARVIKPGRWVVAIEPKMGIRFEQVETSLGPMPASEPVDINHLFESAGLARVNLENAPRFSYCYKKMHI